MKRRRKHKRNISVDNELKTAAFLIDQPQEDFERGVENEKLSLGQISTLIAYLESQYARLTAMANDVTSLSTSGKRAKDDPEVVKTLTGIYAELTKIELKVTYLKKRRETLLPLD